MNIYFTLTRVASPHFFLNENILFSLELPGVHVNRPGSSGSFYQIYVQGFEMQDIFSKCMFQK